MESLKRVIVFIVTWEARLVLARYRPKIVAVTGSVGKTSTKDAIYAALSTKLHVRKSEKSMNSEFGVPLTILGCETGWRNPLRWLSNIAKGLGLLLLPHRYPEWLVLEVGADRPGDIASLARWLRPDIAIITSVPEIPAHVEYFDSVEAVMREKKALAIFLKPDGKLILNNDEERVRAMRSEFRGVTTTYGLEGTADVSASHEEVIYDNAMPVGIRFRINRSGSSVPVSIMGALGNPRIYAALAACAAAEGAGLDLVSAGEGLSRYEPAPGRMRILAGIKQSVLIDDTYNSSPHAAHEALSTLSNLKAARRIAVLGDMLELGKFTAEAHREIGEHAARAADLLITVGLRARGIAEAALSNGMKDDQIVQYEVGESAKAGEDLQNMIKEGDVILVKGSQSMRMEKVVKEIMAEPEKAVHLLVRQDPEWEKR